MFRREKLFQCVKRVSGSNRLTELKRGAWQIDPAQRISAAENKAKLKLLELLGLVRLSNNAAALV